MDKLSRRDATLSKMVFSLLKKEFTLKGKNFLPLGAKCIPFRETPFQKGLIVQESEQEVKQKSCPFVKMEDNLP